MAGSQPLNSKSSLWPAALGFAAGAALSYWGGRARQKGPSPSLRPGSRGMIRQNQKASLSRFGRSQRAFSEVTGGHPEEINGMPVALGPSPR
jgi:hypothetical protein